jgi:energy-coupling factor transporter ATP-binding protein EcfA2
MERRRVIDPKRLWKSDSQPTKVLSKQQNTAHRTYEQLAAEMFPPKSPQKRLKLISAQLEVNETLQKWNRQPGLFVVGILGEQGVGKTTIMNWLAGSRNPMSPTTGIDLYRTPEGLLLLDSQPVLAGHRVSPREDYLTAISLFSVCQLLIIVIEYANGSDMWAFLTSIAERLSELEKKHQEFKSRPEIVFVISKCPSFVFRSKFGNTLGDVIQKSVPETILNHSRIPHQQYWSSDSIDDEDSDDSSVSEMEREELDIHGPCKIYALPNSKRLNGFPTKADFKDNWRLPVRFEVAINDLCANVRGLPRLRLQTKESPFEQSEEDWYQELLKKWKILKQEIG